MPKRRVLTNKLSLKVQDVKILDALTQHGAATPLQIEVKSGLIGVDVAGRLENLMQRGLVVAHPSSYGEDRITSKIYTLSPKGQQKVQQTRLYSNIGKNGEVVVPKVIKRYRIRPIKK